MIKWQAYMGRVMLEITCADSAALLNALSDEKLWLKDVVYCGELDLRVTIAKADYPRLLQITEKLGASVKILRTAGIYRTVNSILKRPVLVTFVICTLFLSLYLPSRVLFISVEGNTSIPTKRILEAAEECGIRFGVSRRNIRSEVMKNALLQEIPQLQWAGINTTGCTAVISVREKTTQEILPEDENQVCSIVATRDGIIQNCTVYQGNPLCTVGQAVKAGQTLVSGYTDHGIITQATRADAEITALTFRRLEVVSPTATASRAEVTKEKTRYSILIGKKLIKLYKDSGNLDTTCAKIYSEEYVRLPGGFQLPIAVIKETVFHYAQSEETTETTDGTNWLAGLAESYLRNTMIAGDVISADTEVETGNDAYYLRGSYACIEMIGQVKFEQTILKDERND